MTIATILGTALIIVAAARHFGLDATAQKVAILSVGALVCIVICIAGDTSQDLKTGYLVKATPWKQQVGEIIGVLTATVALAGVVWLIKDQYGFVESDRFPDPVPAYQTNLMKLVVQGVVDQQLPWNLIFTGMACALVVELLGIPSLPFAVGLYLPLELSTPIMVGGILRWLVDKFRKNRSEASNPGILASSGLVAGHGVMGVLLVGVAALIGWAWNDPYSAPPKYYEQDETWVNFDGEKDAWAHYNEEDETWVHYDEESEAWVHGEAPAPTRAGGAKAEETTPQKPKGERIVPKHLYPWLTTKVGFLRPEYGLTKHKLERGSFRGDYAVDWYKLFPLAPFALMTLWLLIVVMKRLSEHAKPGEPTLEAPEGGPPAPFHEPPAADG